MLREANLREVSHITDAIYCYDIYTEHIYYISANINYYKILYYKYFKYFKI